MKAIEYSRKAWVSSTSSGSNTAVQFQELDGRTTGTAGGADAASSAQGGIEPAIQTNPMLNPDVTEM